MNVPKLKPWTFNLGPSKPKSSKVGKPGSSKSLAMQIIRDRFHRSTKPRQLNHFPDIAAARSESIYEQDWKAGVSALGSLGLQGWHKVLFALN